MHILEKKSALPKSMSRELENKPQTGRKYLQRIRLIKNYSPKYTKLKFINKKTIQFEKGP